MLKKLHRGQALVIRGQAQLEDKRAQLEEYAQETNYIDDKPLYLEAKAS